MSLYNYWKHRRKVQRNATCTLVQHLLKQNS